MLVQQVCRCNRYQSRCSWDQQETKQGQNRPRRRMVSDWRCLEGNISSVDVGCLILKINQWSRQSTVRRTLISWFPDLLLPDHIFRGGIPLRKSWAGERKRFCFGAHVRQYRPTRDYVAFKTGKLDFPFLCLIDSEVFESALESQMPLRLRKPPNQLQIQVSQIVDRLHT